MENVLDRQIAIYGVGAVIIPLNVGAGTGVAFVIRDRGGASFKYTAKSPNVTTGP